MSAPTRIAAVACYTWAGARRRRLVWLPPALLGMTLLLQLPRIVHVVSLVREAGEPWRAAAEYAALVGAVHGNWLLVGSVLALALGAASLGARDLRQRAGPIAARPLSRAEFVAGRLAGQAVLLVVFWGLPAATFAALRVAVGVPDGLGARAWIAPLALQLTLLAWGAVLGASLRVLPATLFALVGVWAGLLLSGGASWTAAGPGRLARWLAPPLADLWRASSPFADGSPPGWLLLQAAAWIGIFGTAAVARFERIDLGARDG